MSALVPTHPAIVFWIAFVPIAGISGGYLMYAQSKIVQGYEEARGGPLARVWGETLGYVGTKQRLEEYHTYYQSLEAKRGAHRAFLHEILTNADQFWRAIGYEYYLKRIDHD